MSTLQTKPTVSTAKKLETAWIGWLNEESSKELDKSKSVQDYVDKRGQLLKTGESFEGLGSKRVEKLQRDIKVEEDRFLLIETLLTPPAPDEIRTAIKEAKSKLKDLTIPKNNDAALQAVAELSRKINKACTDVKPGLGTLLKEIASLEISADYIVALQFDTTLAGSLTNLKDSVKNPATEVSELAKEIQALKSSCRDLTISQKKASEDIATAKLEQKTLEERIGQLKSEVFDACQQYVVRSSENLDDAAKLKITAITKKAIDDYQGEVAELLTAAEKERQKASDFLNTYGTASETKKKDLAALAQVQNKIRMLKEGALDALYAGDIDGMLNLDALSTTYKSTDLDSAKQVLAGMEQAIAVTRKKWEDAKAKCGSLIRFLDTALASSAQSDDDYVRGTDSRSTPAKELEVLARNGRAAYDAAIDIAKGFKYGEALTKLNAALEPTGALGLVSARQKNASNLLGSTKATPTDLEARRTAFNASMGDVTDKSRIRFSSDAMALMMHSGIGLDEDGDIVYSDQFALMKEQLDVGLKMWHGLVDAGCDPFKAAERAFEGIPENYWPPQAVRVIAMFRKAEAEFAGEREAAELTEGLQASSSKKAADVSLEVQQHGAERAADAFSGMLTWYKETHKSDTKGLNDEEIKKKAAEFFKENNKIDFKAASDAVGGLAAGLGALNGAYKVGKGAKDIHEARQKIEAYNPETDSPVALKIAEFERNRAVWHLISDMADTINSALGPAVDVVPALGVIGDAKTLIVSVGEAAVYFSRLRNVKATEKIAKTDPESLAELALANEAHKLGILGAQKTFDAVTSLLKVLGAGLDMGGVTAAAGFGVKAGATVLMYCGKIIFALINWKDRRNAVKALTNARADPTNIEVVELVFERCTMYSRFLLADGALNGDAWCRQYILSRGVTDRDLDNPNTSTAIIREYLNVTFQPKSGDAEEDDDLGTTKSEQEKKKSLPSEEQEFVTWSRAKIELTQDDFVEAYNEACEKGGLKPDKSLKGQLSGLLSAFEKSMVEAQTAMDESEVAFTAFESDKTNATKVSEAERLLTIAINSTATLGHVVNDCQRELRGCVPLATTTDTKGKFKVHASFQLYLRELADAIALAYTPFFNFRNESSKQSMALSLGMDVDSSDLAKSVRGRFDELSTEQKKILQSRTEYAKKAIEQAWDTLSLKTNSAGKGVKAKLIEKVAKSTGMQKSDIETAVNNKFNEIKNPVLQSAGGMCFKLAEEEQFLTVNANKIQDTKARGKELKKIEVTMLKRIDTEVVEYAKEKAAALLAGEFDDAVNELFEQQATGTGKFTPPSVELTRKYWIERKEELGRLGWKFVKTGIGPQLEEFEAANENWKLLPKDDQLQAAYNGAFGKLLNCVQNMPILRADGIAVPGMKKFKSDYIQALKAAKSAFDTTVSNPDEEDPKGQSGGWAVPEGKLGNWPMTCDGWNLINDLAEKHGAKKLSNRKSIAKYFRRLDEALSDFRTATDPTEKSKAKVDARKCATELSNELKNWEKKATTNQAVHPSILACVKKITPKITSKLLDSELK